jgi:hypothetical protein
MFEHFLQISEPLRRCLFFCQSGKSRMNSLLELTEERDYYGDVENIE